MSTFHLSKFTLHLLHFFTSSHFSHSYKTRRTTWCKLSLTMQQFHSPKIPTLTRKLIILTVLLVLLWPRGNNFVQSRPHRSTPVVTIKGNMIMKNNVPVLQQNHRSKFRTKRATTGTAPDFDDTSHDIVSYVDYSSGGTMDDSDIFDMRR